MNKTISLEQDVYSTDDYPRAGCRAVIEVHDTCISMTVHAPADAAQEEPRQLEAYSAQSPDAIAVALFDWLAGRAPRRGYRSYKLAGSM